MQPGNRRVGLVLGAALIIGAMLAAWSLEPALAEDREEAIKARAAAIMQALINGSDAEFEALRDRCVALDGRRRCGDRAPDAAPPAENGPVQDKEQDKEPKPGELVGSGTHAIAGVAPGMRGEANTFTALEDLLRESLEAGQMADAARHARDLARLVDQADADQVQPDTLTTIGRALLATGQIAEAGGFFRRALTLGLTRRQRDLFDTRAASPADALSMRLALMLSGLADVAAAQERQQEARRLYQRAVILMRDDHDDVDVLKAFALFEWAQGRYGEATSLLTRSVELNRRFFGSTSSIADAENKLGHLALAQDRIEEAYRAFRQAAATSTEIALSGVSDPMFHQRGGDYLARKRRLFEDVVSGAVRLAQIKPEERSRLAGESFEAAQWAERTTAAAALSRMTARVAARDPELSTLVRAFEDLLAERQRLEKQLLTLLADQDADADAARARIRTAEKRAGAIRTTLAGRFPKYAALAYPQPTSIADTQALLRPGEALVQFLFTQEEGFAWLATQTEAHVVRLPLGQKALAERVSVLRCGLDSGEWSSRDGAWVADNERCSPLEAERNARKQLPFQPAVAHELYAALFGQLEDLIAGKSLLVVPSGALSALPLHVLVTAPPAAPGALDYRSVQWFALRHNVTVLPSAAALGALRHSEQRVAVASRPFIGFGNPLLNGLTTKPEDVKRAALARRKQECPRVPARTRTAAVKSLLGVRAVLRGDLADVEALRNVPPLPETADELCAVGQTLGAAPEEILLGARATEHAVKSLSAAGVLKNYRVIHFASHGLLASDTESVAQIAAEPALVLTPPETPSEEDDGLLTASEVARLELAADWVILSACNTAAGGIDGEALSGLGRGFFYAGARALLASHWPVYSDATVKLVTGALRRMAANNSVGRSEALRQSMLALIATGQPSEAHPAYWAPFVVVGEGAAALPGSMPAATSSPAPAAGPPPAKAKTPRRRSSERAATPDWRREIWRQ